MKELKILILALLMGFSPFMILGQLHDSSFNIAASSRLFQDDIIKPSKVTQNIHYDISPRLIDMRSFEKVDEIMTAEVRKPIKPEQIGLNGQEEFRSLDPVIQDQIISLRSRIAPQVEIDFSGISREDIAVKYFPPDPNGDVGPDHYIQIVNAEFAIWDKDGNKLLGNLPNKTIWDGFDDGQPFDNKNGIDPIVLYDDYADRWLIGALIPPPSGFTDSYILIAVSTTSDPTGSYYRYAFTFSGALPDYEKFGIWHDGFYMTANELTIPDNWFYGSSLCVFNRNTMINGDETVPMIYFYLGKSHFGLLPADADGSSFPSDTMPHICLALSCSDCNVLEKFTTHTNWDTVQNSAILIDTIHVAPFLNGHSISQPGTNQKLAVLGDRLMHRLQYRNYNSYQALVVNHTVYNPVTKMNGIRWYELRDNGNGFDIHQQGTYMPNDNTHRWMGSIALNGNGDIALGYSASNETNVYPSIRFTGQTAGAPLGLGILDISETNIVVGEYAQTGSNRWGDYSMMTVDPSDDYSFWYTQQYTLGTYKWVTRIANINLESPLCASPSNLSSTKITSTSVNIGWSENGFSEDWEIAIGQKGFNPINSTPVYVNENQFALVDLIPNREYDWYVRTNCGDGEHSEWAGPATFKTLSEGILWSKCYGGSSEDVSNAMTATPDGGYIIAGSTSSNDGDVSGNHGGYDFWLIKIDGSGDTIWTKTYGGSGQEDANDICQTFDGGYIVAGSTQSNDGDITGYHGGGDVWAVKIDSLGNIVWSKCFGGSNYETANSIQQTSDGGYIFTGKTNSADGDVLNYSGNMVDGWFVKLDNNGNIEWSDCVGLNTPNTYSDESINSIIQTKDGGYVFCGNEFSIYSNGNNYTNNTAMIVKLDNSGNIEWWESFIGSPCGDYTYPTSLISIKQTSDDGYVVTGFKEILNDCWFYGGFQNWVIKLDNSGNTVWSNYYGIDQDNSENSEASKGYDIVELYNGDYFVCEDFMTTPNGSNSANYDLLIMRTNADGDSLWSKQMGGNYSDNGRAILANEETILVTGYTESNNGDVYGNHGGFDFWVVKIDGEYLDEINSLLPFTENWEAYSGELRTNDTIYKGEHYSWTFETDVHNQGRVRWGSDAFKSYGGDGSLTFDKVVGNGSNASNGATLTLNLANYINDDVYLSFSWADHNDEEHAGDKVWVRGSDVDEWAQVYDFNPQKFTDNAFHDVNDLNVSATLASASPAQIVGSTFQLRFGQQDNYWADHDGITIDNIMITDEPMFEIMPVSLPFVEDWEAYSGLVKVDTIVYLSTYSWSFETDKQNEGRARWGTQAYMASGGGGALTLDKTVGNGNNALNYAILKLNMSNYLTSDLYLTFRWADHNDEEHGGDKVWVRGSETDKWVQIYDFNPQLFTDNAFHDVNDLDITAALAAASPAQNVSSSFQIRFGQQDNHWAGHDGITIDNIVVSDVPIHEITPTALPFVEDWEAYSGEQKTDTVFYQDTYSWAFETDVQGQGRASFGTDAYIPNTGLGAITLDKAGGSGDNALNHAILTLNLVDYVASSDLELSFFWADHNDENHGGDKVWARGSDADEWVELVYLAPQSAADNVYQFVEGLDIDATLAGASPSQVVSESLQIRFGQQDNYWFYHDGISYDDIVVEEKNNKSIDPITNEQEEDFSIYYSDNYVNIRSYGEAIKAQKQVLVYDLYGRVIVNQIAPPEELSRIQVLPCSCYLVVKVLGKQQIKVEKVFVK